MYEYYVHANLKEYNNIQHCNEAGHIRSWHTYWPVISPYEGGRSGEHDIYAYIPKRHNLLNN